MDKMDGMDFIDGMDIMSGKWLKRINRQCPNINIYVVNLTPQ